MIWVVIAVAGGLGAVARYLVDRWISARVTSHLPWGTWVVNVTGSFLAGVIAGLVVSDLVDRTFETVVAGGFLGAYTTFSTAMFQAALEFDSGERTAGAINLVGTLIASVLAASLGVLLVR